MAKFTLLDIVQAILNDMDSDEVNSIDDTVEAGQVAQIVKTTYIDMMSNRNWPHTAGTINLTASNSVSTPTHMTIEDDVKEFISINYNKASVGETRRKYSPIYWMEPDDFLRFTNKRNSDETNIDIIVDPTGVELLIRNDKAPDKFTSFNDKTLVFDSYDNIVDNTLQSSKTQARGFLMKTLVIHDDTIPDLPDEAFSALIAEATTRAQLKLRQVQDVSAANEASKQQRWLSKKARRIANFQRYPDYGRKSAKYNNKSTFEKNDPTP